MAKAAVLYERVGRRRAWFPFGRNRLWTAADHLLLIRDLPLRENYSRIYWSDIEAILLYSLPHPSGFMLAAEILCAFAFPAIAPFIDVFWGSMGAAVFLAIYASWRAMQPNWGCQVTTRLSTLNFPLRSTLNSSRAVVEILKARAGAAQNSGADFEIQSTVFIGDRNWAQRNSPRLAVHAVTFSLGLFAGLNKIVLVLYFAALLGLYFSGRRLKYPLSVRSAVLMSQILAALEIAWWFRHPVGIISYALLRPDWIFSISRVLFSLLGIAAVYQRSMEASRYQLKSSNVLGLS